jgi:hypothetical protein
MLFEDRFCAQPRDKFLVCTLANPDNKDEQSALRVSHGHRSINSNLWGRQCLVDKLWYRKLPVPSMLGLHLNLQDCLFGMIFLFVIFS